MNVHRHENNTNEIYLIDVVMEEEFEIQPSLQTKESINGDEAEERINENFFKLHFQRRKWRHDNRNSLCWSFYYVNDDKLVDVKCFQLMRCLFIMQVQF